MIASDKDTRTKYKKLSSHETLTRVQTWMHIVLRKFQESGEVSGLKKTRIKKMQEKNMNF